MTDPTSLESASASGMTAFASRKWWVPVAGLLLLYSSTPLPEATLGRLTAEDGVYENAGAVFFLATSLVFGYGYFRDLRPSRFLYLHARRNHAYLLLALFFFFVFGEEISWGQRIWGIDGGAFFKTMNAQQETNLHNLKWFNVLDENQTRQAWWKVFPMNRLFRMFWLFWCLLIPITTSFSVAADRLFHRLGIPHVDPGFGVLLLINYTVMKWLETILPARIEMVEIEECAAAFLLLLAATDLTGLTGRASVIRNTPHGS